MKKNIFYLLALLFPLLLCGISFSQTNDYTSLNGIYSGNFTSGSFSLKFSVNFLDDGKSAFFSSEDQYAEDIPLQKLRYKNDSVMFDLVGDVQSFLFAALVGKDKLTGSMRVDSSGGLFTLIKETGSTKTEISSEEFTINNGDVQLSGTFFSPADGLKHPLVVFNHGSGPEGRWANQWMAKYFARNGICSFVYDKRGAGRSTGDWRRSGFNDLAGDCIAIINSLKNNSHVDPLHIGIFGHSQGAIYSPLVAAMEPRVSFIIAVASTGGPLWEQEIYRTKNDLIASGLSPEQTDSAMAFFKVWLNYAIDPVDWSAVEKETAKYSDASWFPYVTPPPKESYIWDFYKKIGNFNSLPYWEKINIPVLLIYGNADENTDFKNSSRTISEAQSGNPLFRLIFFENATHEMNVKSAPNDFPWFKKTPGYSDTLISWVKNITGTESK